jgi:WD40 repeat protein
LFNGETGEALRSLAEQPGPVSSLALTADSALVASGSEGGTIKFFNAADGADRLALTGHAGPIHCLSFNTSGDQIASAGEDGTIRLWRLPQAGRPLSGHTMPVTAVAISADGKLSATGSADKSVKLWNTSDGTAVRSLPPHAEAVSAVAFRGDDGTARLWDAAAGTELRKFALELTEGETPTPFYDAALSPNGQLVATAGADRQVHLFNAANGQLARTLTGHADPVYRVLFNPTSTRLISCGHAGSLIIWNPADGAQLATVQLPAVAYHAALSPDGKRIVASCADGKAYVAELPAAAQ